MIELDVGSPFAISRGMSRAKSELIVPVRDRRQRRRILTLKNLRNAALVVLGLFAGLTVLANLRGRNAPKDDYGRLYGHQIQTPDIKPKQPEVVTEAVNDQDHADPTLIRNQVRAQLLQADSNVPTETAPTPVAAASTMTPPVTGQERVAIVGGPEGVQLVRKNSERPVLGGGFGRH